MIFMALVGGLGTFEGAILGAVVFFAIEAWFGAAGVWYLVGLGAAALVFALALPRGIWGWVEDRTALRLLPVGYRVYFGAQDGAAATRPPSAPGARLRSTRCAAQSVAGLGGMGCCSARRSSSPGSLRASARASAQLAVALGADVIGVDVNPPAVAARRLRQGRHRLALGDRRAGRPLAEPH